MKQKYEEDLREIREIMSRSSRFISLSGLSGISAGIIGLVAAYLAWKYVFIQHAYFSYQTAVLPDPQFSYLLMLSFGTLLMAIGTTFYFTQRAGRKKQGKVWDLKAKRLLINLLIPLVSGGLICLILLFKGLTGFAVGLSLVFYGLALVNAGKYTLPEVRMLGLVQLSLGIAGILFIELGLVFWALGFGVVHMLYGIFMNLKYKS